MEEAQSRAEKLRLLKERAQAKRQREEGGGEDAEAAEDGGLAQLTAALSEGHGLRLATCGTSQHG